MRTAVKGNRGAQGSCLWPCSCQHSTGPGKLGGSHGLRASFESAAADLKGKKIKELLNAGFPSEVKTGRQGELFFPHQCSNVREGFSQEK